MNGHRHNLIEAIDRWLTLFLGGAFLTACLLGSVAPVFGISQGLEAAAAAVAGLATASAFRLRNRTR